MPRCQPKDSSANRPFPGEPSGACYMDSFLHLGRLLTATVRSWKGRHEGEVLCRWDSQPCLFLRWKYLPPPSGEEHGISPIEDSRIRFTEEHGRCQEWDRDRLSRLQALQPDLTGLRVKGPSRALLVLTFQLAYFSWRVTPTCRNQVC